MVGRIRRSLRFALLGGRGGARDCRVHAAVLLRWCDTHFPRSKPHGWWCPKCFETCPDCQGLHISSVGYPLREYFLPEDHRRASRIPFSLREYRKEAEAPEARSGDRGVFRRAAARALRGPRKE